jgi:hypothetical protein
MRTTDIPLAITLYDSRHTTRIPESAVPKVCLVFSTSRSEGARNLFRLDSCVESVEHANSSAIIWSGHPLTSYLLFARLLQSYMTRIDFRLRFEKKSLWRYEARSPSRIFAGHQVIKLLPEILEWA